MFGISTARDVKDSTPPLTNYDLSFPTATPAGHLSASSLGLLLAHNHGLGN
jgi:hypothetical protein